MPYDSARHQRRSIRLRGYDYRRPGAYFITVCVQDRRCLFGRVENGRMRLNPAGRAVAARWRGLPARFPRVGLDAYVVMPDHVHGILVLGDGGASLVDAPTGVGDVVGAFKSISTRAYMDGVERHGWPRFDGQMWQRNYWEHIIRTERALHAIRRYIIDNPRHWNPPAQPQP